MQLRKYAFLVACLFFVRTSFEMYAEIKDWVPMVSIAAGTCVFGYFKYKAYKQEIRHLNEPLHLPQDIMSMSDGEFTELVQEIRKKFGENAITCKSGKIDRVDIEKNYFQKSSLKMQVGCENKYPYEDEKLKIFLKYKKTYTAGDVVLKIVSRKWDGSDERNLSFSSKVHAHFRPLLLPQSVNKKIYYVGATYIAVVLSLGIALMVVSK